MKITKQQLIREYTGRDGTTIRVIHLSNFQCPNCLATLECRRLNGDMDYFDLEWPCPNCKKK